MFYCNRAVDRPVREVLAPDEVLWRGPRCSVCLSTLAPHVFGTVYSGYIDSPTTSASLTDLERLFGDAPRITVFSDSTGVIGYDTSARLKAADWMIKMSERFAACHVLESSRMVAMGLAVMNMAVGGTMLAHSTRESFDEAQRALGVKLRRHRAEG